MRLSDSWSFFTLVCVALAGAPLLTACTSLKNQQASQASREPIEFNGLWTAHGFPCRGDAAGPLLLHLEQHTTQLTATSVMSSACVRLGSLLFQGALPKERVAPADLPVTFDVELPQDEHADDQATDLVAASATVISVDRLVLETDVATVVVVRGVEAEDPGPAPTGSSGEGEAEPAREPKAGAGGRRGSAASGGRGGSPSRGGSGSSAPEPPDIELPDAAVGGGEADGSSAGAAGSEAPDVPDAPTADGGVSSGVAGSGGGEPAGSSGDWYCLNVDSSCTCIEASGMSGDSCTQKPTCCFTLVALGQNSCQCWPEDSTTCRDQPSENPDAKPVATCPPP